MRPLQIVILAGGRSKRFGTDKAWMELDGALVLPALCERLAAVTPSFGDVIVVRRDASQQLPALPSDVVVVEDMVPGAGPLGGLVSGMWRDTAAFTFACACDMPFVDAGLVRWMAEWRDPELEDEMRPDIIVPEADGRLQWLHALYFTMLPPLMLGAVEDGPDRSLHGWHTDLNVNVIPIPQSEWEAVHPSGRSFLNINSQADLPTLH